MRRNLFALALFAVAGVGFAQNSVVYKMEGIMRDKQDYKGAIEIGEAALQNPKTTKFAQINSYLGRAYGSLFNEELSRAASQLPFDTVAFCNYLDKTVEAVTASYTADHTPDAKGNVKPQYDAMNKLQMHQLLNYYFFAGGFNAASDLDKAVHYYKKFIDLPKNVVFSQQETDSIYEVGKKNYALASYNIAYIGMAKKDWAQLIEYSDAALAANVLDEQQVHDLYVMRQNAFIETNDTVNYVLTLRDGAAATGAEGFTNDLINYYMRTQKRDEAIEMANTLIQKDPSRKSSYYILGVLEMNMMPYNYDAARAAFQKALDIDPDYVDANRNMGVCWVNDIVEQRQQGKIKLPTGSDNASKQKFNEIKEQKIDPYYRNALPYFEKLRNLTPDEPANWAEGLYNIYTNLQMFDAAREVKPFTNNP